MGIELKLDSIAAVPHFKELFLNAIIYNLKKGSAIGTRTRNLKLVKHRKKWIQHVGTK